MNLRTTVSLYIMLLLIPQFNLFFFILVRFGFVSFSFMSFHVLVMFKSFSFVNLTQSLVKILSVN